MPSTYVPGPLHAITHQSLQLARTWKSFADEVAEPGKRDPSSIQGLTARRWQNRDVGPSLSDSRFCVLASVPP